MTPPTTRLAPSPTGALHLGNARTFLITWSLARAAGWRIVLRIEDLDGPRIKTGAAAAAIETLAWLGIDWDEGPITQSDDLSPYRDAMALLAGRGAAFACDLSRAELESAASAPNAGDPAEPRFPPELRPTLGPRSFAAGETNWRLVVEDEPVAFDDALLGAVVTNPGRSVGDFVIWTKRGVPAYQLAVAVDDARHRVTHVVRGDDLADSTGRQLLVYRALGLTAPRFWMHLPLVVGPDGRRLAKRHGDTRIDHYRARGVPADRLIGLLAWWSGAAQAREPMPAAEFAARLRTATIPRTPVQFSAEDDAWLLRR